MKKMSVWLVLVLFAGPTTWLAACGDTSMLGGSGPEFGATQGGVQDMGFARELIANGQVPPPEAFTVEGMFSEHDLPIEGDPCETVLCLRQALGIAPTLGGIQSIWLQVGMSSLIDPRTYERPSLSLVATVDVSGSMGWNYSDDRHGYPTPGALSRSLLRDVASRLGAADRIAIVTYGTNVDTRLGLTRGDDREAVYGAIDGLHEAGSTNMEGGLRRAFEIAREARGTDQVRVMLFTDVQPNVGATTPTEFQNIAGDMANQGIGLTVMGMGLGLGQEVLDAMVNMRGGNAFSLFSYEDVDYLMEDSWPWMVSPIAYDLAVELIPVGGISIADAYGFPGEHQTTAGFQVATVFLSRRKGALLLRLTSPLSFVGFSGQRVRGRLTYETVQGEQVEDQFVAVCDGWDTDDRGMFFEQPVVGKTVALAVLVSNMRRAAAEYESSRQRAVEIMQAVVERFEADAGSLHDEALQPEVDLAGRLLRLMEQGAPQGDLYGMR